MKRYLEAQSTFLVDSTGLLISLLLISRQKKRKKKHIRVPKNERKTFINVHLIDMEEAVETAVVIIDAFVVANHLQWVLW